MSKISENDSVSDISSLLISHYSSQPQLLFTDKHKGKTNKQKKKTKKNLTSVHLQKEKKVKSLSPVRVFETPWAIAHQAPPSMAFSRQEYWSGLPFPSPGDLPDPTSPQSLTKDKFFVLYRYYLIS